MDNVIPGSKQMSIISSNETLIVISFGWKDFGYFCDVVAWMLLLVVIGLFTIALWNWYSLPTPRRPPGPKWYNFPIFGHIWSIERDNFHLTLHEMAKLYGPIFAVQLGSVNTVVLSSSKLIKESFSHSTFCGQAPMCVANYMHGGCGLINSDDRGWGLRRPVIDKCLAGLGEKEVTVERPEKPFELKLQGEITYLVEELDANGNFPINPHELILKLVRGFMFRLILGKGFDTNKHRDFANQLNLSSLEFLPILKLNYLFHGFMTAKLVTHRHNHHFLMDLISQQVESKRQPPAHNFLDDYLSELERQDKDISAEPDFDEEQLCHVLADLLGTGVQTLLSSILWGLAHLMHNPRIVRRAQREIDRAIGCKRITVPNDIVRLPFVDACIYEIERMCPALPFGMPHGTTEDCMMDDYFIPKNSLVLGLIYADHYDPAKWEDPKKFNPARFLDTRSGIVLPEHFIPFGSGLRGCPAENMAHNSMFLVFSALMQRYHFKRSDNAKIPKGELGFTRALLPPKIWIQFVRRQESFTK